MRSNGRPATLWRSCTVRNLLTQAFEPFTRRSSNMSVLQPILSPLAWLSLLLAWTCPAFAQDRNSPSLKESTPVPSSAIQELSNQQRALSNRFATLEELFLRMSELESSANPTRSALLLQAAKMSKEQAMIQRMAAATEHLSRKEFQRAIEEQQASSESLKKLLELLQSENRQDRVREERKKYEQWIKDLKRLERIERSLRARTESGQSPQESARDQADVENQAKEIADQMKELIEQLSEGKNPRDSNDSSSDKPSTSDRRRSRRRNKGSQTKRPIHPKSPATHRRAIRKRRRRRRATGPSKVRNKECHPSRRMQTRANHPAHRPTTRRKISLKTLLKKIAKGNRHRRRTSQINQSNPMNLPSQATRRSKSHPTRKLKIHPRKEPRVDPKAKTRTRKNRKKRRPRSDWTRQGNACSVLRSGSRNRRSKMPS